MNEPAPSIGDLIRRARQRKRMTQTELAAALGVARPSVTRWESGQHFPLQHTGAIEEVLGIELPLQPETVAQ
jgi:transcriptional regulator with XRE-family HTH domain